MPLIETTRAAFSNMMRSTVLMLLPVAAQAGVLTVCEVLKAAPSLEGQRIHVTGRLVTQPGYIYLYPYPIAECKTSLTGTHRYHAVELEARSLDSRSEERLRHAKAQSIEPGEVVVVVVGTLSSKGSGYGHLESVPAKLWISTVPAARFVRSQSGGTTGVGRHQR